MLYQRVSGTTVLVKSCWAAVEGSESASFSGADIESLRSSHMLLFVDEPLRTVEAVRFMKNYCFFPFLGTTPRVPLPPSSQNC